MQNKTKLQKIYITPLSVLGINIYNFEHFLITRENSIPNKD